MTTVREIPRFQANRGPAWYTSSRNAFLADEEGEWTSTHARSGGESTKRGGGGSEQAGVERGMIKTPSG